MWSLILQLSSHSVPGAAPGIQWWLPWQFLLEVLLLVNGLSWQLGSNTWVGAAEIQGVCWPTLCLHSKMGQCSNCMSVVDYIGKDVYW